MDNKVYVAGNLETHEVLEATSEEMYNPNELDLLELRLKGFQPWDTLEGMIVEDGYDMDLEDYTELNKRVLLLIPYTEHKKIVDETVIYSIMGEKNTFKEVRDDIGYREGCLAYGVIKRKDVE